MPNKCPKLISLSSEDAPVEESQVGTQGFLRRASTADSRTSSFPQPRSSSDLEVPHSTETVTEGDDTMNTRGSGKRQKDDKPVDSTSADPKLRAELQAEKDKNKVLLYTITSLKEDKVFLQSQLASPRGPTSSRLHARIRRRLQQRGGINQGTAAGTRPHHLPLSPKRKIHQRRRRRHSSEGERRRMKTMNGFRGTTIFAGSRGPEGAAAPSDKCKYI
ncbi:uncharacterized protein ACWYII_024279 [Salvelinus alpinus]